MSGFGDYTNAAMMQQPQAPVFTLSFGLEETGGLVGQLIPEGIHTFRTGSTFEIKTTREGEQAIVLNVTVVRSDVPGALGTGRDEWITIPGEARKANNHESWKSTMKFLRARLEALTGRYWRDNNIQLDPAELVNKEFIATVTHKQSDPVPQEDGTLKYFTNANLNNWTAIHAGVGQQTFGGGATPPQTLGSVVQSAQQAQPQPAANQFGAQPNGGFALPTGPGGAPVTYDQQQPQTMPGGDRPVTYDEAATQAALATEQPQQAPPQQAPPQQAPPPGTDTAFGGAFANLGAPAQQQPQQQPAPDNQVYDPREEPF